MFHYHKTVSCRWFRTPTELYKASQHWPFVGNSTSCLEKGNRWMEELCGGLKDALTI